MSNTEKITSLQGEPEYRVRQDDSGELVHDIHPVYVYSLKKDTPQEEMKEIAQDMVIGKRPDIVKYYNSEANTENKALNDYYNVYKKAYDDGSWWKPKFTAEQYRTMTPGEASELLTHPKDIAEWYRTRGSQGYGKLLAGIFGIPAAIIGGAALLPWLPSIAPSISHGLTVLANPLAANTTLGALTATGIDAAGTIYGLQRNSELLNKWSNGQFNWSDVPEFGLNMVPGYGVSKTVSGAQKMATVMKTSGNLATKVKAAKDMINSPVQQIPMLQADAIDFSKLSAPIVTLLDDGYMAIHRSKPLQFVRNKLLATNAKWLDEKSKLGQKILDWRFPQRTRERLFNQAHEYNNIQRASQGLPVDGIPSYNLDVTIPTWRKSFLNDLGRLNFSTGPTIAEAWASGNTITFPVSTLLRPASLHPRHVSNPKNIFAHEMRHVIQHGFNGTPELRSLPQLFQFSQNSQFRLPDLTRERINNEYFGANKEIVYNNVNYPYNRYLEHDALALGQNANSTWTKSLHEFDAETAMLREALNVPLIPYHKLPIETKNRFLKYLTRRFSIDKSLANEIATDLSLNGYKDGGKLVQ